MKELADIELLRAYVTDGSEESFALLVKRHLDLVYSAVLRRVRDPHLAEEIVQATFIILARKANSLGPKTILPAWLYRTAQFAAADTIKMKSRRLKHEQEAARMETNEPDTTWKQVEPLLDAAIGQLREVERTAVVLRFLENKSLREVGAAMGLTEDTAQKRVARALEKLRTIFARSGVIVSTGVLGSAVTSHAVQTAPIGLAESVVTAAALPQAVLAGSVAAVVKGTLDLIFWSKIKAGAIAAGAIGAVGLLGAVGFRLARMLLHGTWGHFALLLSVWGVHLAASAQSTNGAQADATPGSVLARVANCPPIRRLVVEVEYAQSSRSVVLEFRYQPGAFYARQLSDGDPQPSSPFFVSPKDTSGGYWNDDYWNLKAMDWSQPPSTSNPMIHTTGLAVGRDRELLNRGIGQFESVFWYFAGGLNQKPEAAPGSSLVVSNGITLGIRVQPQPSAVLRPTKITYEYETNSVPLPFPKVIIHVVRVPKPGLPESTDPAGENGLERVTFHLVVKEVELGDPAARLPREMLMPEPSLVLPNTTRLVITNGVTYQVRGNTWSRTDVSQ